MGEHYDELQSQHVEPDDKARADVQGAEVAVERDMVFVTNDENLEDAIEEVEPDCVIHLDDFRQHIGIDG